MPGWGTTKDENAACHSGLDPESRHKRLDIGSRTGTGFAGMTIYFHIKHS
jgi:hypothetical protein